ncbi:FKBP-type peptidyl-prolyl cis-trans isomerase FklB [Minicystis rosea]|nr:FKBP-type peptidyl-prolyl cis-trans isomerase FklB [Minicystis rosea]
MSQKQPIGRMACALVALALAGTGCARGKPRPDQQSAESTPETAGKTAAVDTKPESPTPGPGMENRKDKLSYAFGVDMARTIQGQKERLNVELLKRALSDTLEGNKLVMTDEEVTSTIKTFEAELKQDFQHARVMVSTKNKQQGEAFFAENAKKEGVVTLPSGLQYKVLNKGSGKVPTREDTVVCNYRGTRLDGTEIDSSYKRKEPTAIPVKSVIPGFSQALQLMPVGSKWQLFVPPQLAYGDKAAPAFGPNSTLVFEVELLAIRDEAQAKTASK